MPTNLVGIDFVKTLRLKQVGLALAVVWVIVLVAAVASTIYREIDGPTVRDTVAENVSLAKSLVAVQKTNDTALSSLSSALVSIDELSVDLLISRAELQALRKRFESYLSSAPSIRSIPDSLVSFGSVTP